MKEYEQQGAQPLPYNEPFFTQQETPKEKIKALRNKILSFSQEIEDLLKQPLLTDHDEFLDKIAADIVSLHQLTLTSSLESTATMDSRKLINNILNCKVFIEKQLLDISLIDSAKSYRKSKKNKQALSLLLKGMILEKKRALMLAQEMKLLVIDLTAEMESI